MDKMKAIYIEEANELLTSLEADLLSLEANRGSKAHIEQVFRIMHTLKGNSSMFGLNSISEFVHDLETIYDKIRSGETALTKDLLNCTFAAVDHLKLIIADAELSNEKNRENHRRLLKQIQAFAKNTHEKQSPESDGSSAELPAKTFYVRFTPDEHIFLNGTNPLLVIAELTSLGKNKVLPHFKTINPHENFDAEKCTTWWEVLLETAADEKTIRDVFVFVEDQANIEIRELKGKKLGNNAELDKLMEGVLFSDTPLALEEALALLVAEVETEKYSTPATEGKREKIVASVRVSSEKLDDLMNLVSELVTTQASLALYHKQNPNSILESISENVEKLTRQLRDVAFGMTLVPINNLFGKFQRMVRDLSEQLEKDVNFITTGGETELDKTIIDHLADPIMHLLRNSLDHGLENRERRLENGKPEKGTVLLKAFYSGANVLIQIKDDGKGINSEFIREKAIAKGLISADAVLSEKEIQELIFAPGFSTAATITDVSGRGVGMDVVKRNIIDVNGEVNIDSVYKTGTTITIKLPLTLSIIDGLLVKIDDAHFVVPLAVVGKCFEIERTQLLDNFSQLVVLDKEQIPFVNLRSKFNLPESTQKNEQLIVVESEDRRVGLVVDSIIGEFQAVLKPLGRYYKNQDFISGATLLGDGTIALVLDTNGIITRFTQLLKPAEA